ncbi:hypothetical protein SAMN04489761_0158 [Tenacibaculum sp. MAR_2009_124]|uniref:hypothetical protein n=1 Tax=Tenacibaculum sp. MAR_2009_124 TaxID=1250059 RepID=UPI0008945232|nr:hypothetical protein [Tenacibaculum sp. MAR_2009_124]SEB36446.1 hypothetical protein SAMN04489761_0158 [Tenacibaculum sp. MAR_2009_124]
MKKAFLKVFVVLFSMVTMVSCSKSDEDINYNASDLLGEWNLASYTYSGNFDVSNGTISLYTGDFEGRAINIDAITTFTENPNKANYSGSYDLSVQQTDSNGETTQNTYTLDNTTSVVDWELRDNLLILSNGELVEVDLPDEISSFTNLGHGDLEIIELTSNSLKLRKSIDQNFSQGGVTAIIKLEMAVDYTR